MMAKVSKKAYTTLITSKKNVVGDSRGNTMVQKRRQGVAPSIVAASISERGIDCSTWAWTGTTASIANMR